ncbi:transmembrane protein 273-like isoform X1 [Acanthopagrus latus]|uniref:transmembrane protein 273-like isoform X1 n=1 Tax=Acanthopagrus latus TaxID=8177 RepID=UPI00187C5FC2|nr:transmembrane protein 273-like isoform X1 [Acanthopagrus latus]
MSKDSLRSLSVNCSETKDMRARQMCGCFPAVLRAVLITESLLTSVRGDGAGSGETIDIKYALIGGGIGLFIVAGFIILKVCMIRKQAQENGTDDRMRRPSEPHLFTMSHLSQSEQPIALVSRDMQC